jgi:hypothetical protein
MPRVIWPGRRPRHGDYGAGIQSLHDYVEAIPRSASQRSSNVMFQVPAPGFIRKCIHILQELERAGNRKSMKTAGE